jgi:hypothetical protein
LTLAQSYPYPLKGTVKLAFAANASGLPPDYIDIQFLTGIATSQVDIPAGSLTTTLPPIQLGSVAGDITATLSSLTVAGSEQSLPMAGAPPSVKITIPRMAPAIMPGSVKITNVTASGFQVVLDADSTTRDLSKADLVFNPVSGTQLAGTQAFTVPLTTVTTPWFDQANADGVACGGAFSLTIPFTFSGDVSAIGSVSVTLTNSVATSSAVSGR